MNINDAFPSKYLRASDLQGRNVTVKIDRMQLEKLGNDTKLVLYFQGKEKGMVLNKINSNAIAHIYGEETDDWTGSEITLFEAMVDFQGKTVPAIRVRAPQRKAAPAAKHQAAPPRMPADNSDMNDDIPF